MVRHMTLTHHTPSHLLRPLPSSLTYFMDGSTFTYVYIHSYELYLYIYLFIYLSMLCEEEVVLYFQLRELNNWHCSSANMIFGYSELRLLNAHKNFTPPPCLGKYNCRSLIWNLGLYCLWTNKSCAMREVLYDLFVS